MATPINDADFDAQVLKAKLPVFVDFWAPWCGPCKMMLPIVDELTKEYEGKVNFVKMNVDENTEVAGKYGVMSIPTFMIFKDGDIAKQFVGVKSKEDVKQQLDAVIAGA